MRSLVSTLLALALSLAFIAGAVFGLNDRGILVPPPEAVVEGFVRELETGRYAGAAGYLGHELAGRCDPSCLGEMAQALLQEAGDVVDVRGEARRIAGDEATASALVTTRRGDTIRRTFTLCRESGLWKISG